MILVESAAETSGSIGTPPTSGVRTIPETGPLAGEVPAELANLGNAARCRTTGDRCRADLTRTGVVAETALFAGGVTLYRRDGDKLDAD
jgi:hypothetical protein